MKEELAVSCCEGTDEVHLKGLYSLLSCIDSVIVEFDQKVVALFHYEKFCYYSTCLIVHDV